MCLQSLMKFHHCLFNILRKNHNVADGQMDRKTDGWTDGLEGIIILTKYFMHGSR